MQWFSAGGIFYIIDNVILPLGSTILLLFFLLFLIRMIKKDQTDIFDDAQMMNPKDAKAYIKKMRKEKMQKEFDTLLGYGKLKEGDSAEYLKLREEGIAIKEILHKLNPEDEEDKN